MNIKIFSKVSSLFLIILLVFPGFVSVDKANAAANITMTTAQITGPNTITLVMDTGGDNLTAAPITAFGAANDGVGALTLTFGGVRNITALTSGGGQTVGYSFSGAPAAGNETGTLHINNPTVITDNGGDSYIGAETINVTDGQGSDIGVTSAQITGANQITIVFNTGGDNLTAAPITAFGAANDGVGALTLVEGGVRDILSLDSLVAATRTAVYTFSGAPVITYDTGSLNVNNPTAITDAVLDTFNVSTIDISDGQFDITINTAEITGPNQLTLTFYTGGHSISAAPITAFGAANNGVGALTLVEGGVRDITVLTGGGGQTAIYSFSGAAVSTNETGTLHINNPTVITDNGGDSYIGSSMVNVTDGQEAAVNTATKTDTIPGTQAATFTDVPVYRLQVTNSGEVSDTINSLSLTPSGTVDDTLVTLHFYDDINNNGTVDDGETNLGASTAFTTDDTKKTFDITNITVPASGTINILVTADGAGLTDSETFVLSLEATSDISMGTVQISGSAPGVNAHMLTIDALAPNVPNINAPTSPTFDVTPTITGTGENDATVVLTSDVDGVIAVTDVVEGGVWSITPGVDLSYGTHSLTALQTDESGNASGASGAQQIIIALSPDHLAFNQQPTETVYGSVISPYVTVQILDNAEGIVDDDTTEVTLTLGTNPGTGTLEGTLTQTAVNGVATFNDITIDQVGIGYTLIATPDLDITTDTSSTFDIIPKQISVTAQTDNKEYDGDTSSLITPVGDSLVGDDTYTTEGIQTFADKNVGGGKIITPSGTIINDGNGGANYDISYVADTGEITAKELVGSITVDNKTYDGTSSATILTRTLDGTIVDDNVSYVGGTATFDTAAVGVGKVVTAVGLSLSGSDAGNYTVNGTATTTADITAAAVSSSSSSSSTSSSRSHVQNNWTRYYAETPEVKTEEITPTMNTQPLHLVITSGNFVRTGSKGPSVAVLQELLNQYGAIPELTTDGIFGPMTQSAVKTFQLKHGLTPDGIVGPMTFAVFLK